MSHGTSVSDADYVVIVDGQVKFCCKRPSDATDWIAKNGGIIAMVLRPVKIF